MNIEDQSRDAAQLWWSPQPVTPTMVAIAARPMPQRSLQSPSPVGALGLALLGLVFSPFGIAAWIWSGRQLDAMERGEMWPRNRGTLIAAKVLGVIETIAMITGVVLVLALSR